MMLLLTAADWEHFCITDPQVVLVLRTAHHSWFTGAFRCVAGFQNDDKRSTQVATSGEEKQNSKPLRCQPSRLPSPAGDRPCERD